jgi:hypothetical protein
MFPGKIAGVTAREVLRTVRDEIEVRVVLHTIRVHEDVLAQATFRNKSEARLCVRVAGRHEKVLPGGEVALAFVEAGWTGLIVGGRALKDACIVGHDTAGLDLVVFEEGKIK